MNKIFLDALFKGFPVPPEFGKSTFVNSMRVQRRTFSDARRQILDAMIELGMNNITAIEIATKIGVDITAQMVNHHMKRMQADGLVKRERKSGKASRGGQAPVLWSLVK